MSDDESQTGEVDRLLDAIRHDWRRLADASTELERRRIRKAMHRCFEELRERLEQVAPG